MSFSILPKNSVIQSKISANINSCDATGCCTPLHCAVFYGKLDEVKRRIEKVSNVNSYDEIGSTPLHYAVELGRLDIAALLIENDADVNAAVAKGCTPLHIAVVQGKSEIVKLLIEKGANVKECDANGYMPLYYAKKSGHTDIVKLLTRDNITTEQVKKDSTTKSTWVPSITASEFKFS